MLKTRPSDSSRVTDRAAVPISWPWVIMLICALSILLLNFQLWARFIGQFPTLRGYLAQTDFVNWFAATRMLAAGQGVQIYDPALHQATESAMIAPYVHTTGGLLYHYWPVLAGLLLPIVQWPPEMALVAWIIVCAVAFTVAIVLLVRDLGFRPAAAGLFVLAAWSFMPLIGDLEMGQTSALLCLPLVLGLIALRRGADGWAGIALGILLLKPQHAALWIVALVAARRWRALAGCAVMGAVLLAVSTWMAGPGWFAAWLNLSHQAVNETTGGGFDAMDSHNFKQLISMIPGVGPAGANLVQLALIVPLAAVVGWLWWRMPAGMLRGAAGGRLIAFTILATLLATPVLLTHDLTFWVVSAAFLLAPWAGSDSFLPRRNWVLLAWLGWLVPWPTVIMLRINPVKLDAVYMLALCVILVVSLYPLVKRLSAPTSEHASR
jgi:arabinofuranan 3-O-arabinosyltransferase